MKRMLSLLLLAAVLFSALPVLADDVITAEPWVTDSGSRLQFAADRKGTLTNVNGQTFEGEWTMDGSTVVFSYQLYGNREMRLTLGEEGENTVLMNEAGAVFYQASKIDAAREAAKKDSKAYPLKWGEQVLLDFVTLQLDGAQIYRKMIGSSGFGLGQPEKAGAKYFALTGTLKNTSGAEMPVSRIKVEMTFDGKNTYTGGCYVDYNGSFSSNLPAQGSGPLYLYVSVPNSIAESFQTVTVRFGFNDSFHSAPAMTDQSEFLFEIEVDQEKAAASKQEPPKEKTYFDESPSLPVPTSYIDVRQSSHSSSSTNGKVKSIKYSYRLIYDSDDGNKVFPKYIEGLKADGYTVKQSGKKYVVNNGGKKLVTVTFDKNTLSLDIVPGNGKLKTLPKPKTAASSAAASQPASDEEPTEKIYKLGDALTTSYAQFKLTKSGSAKKLYSYLTKRQPRNWRYYYADSGNTLFYVQGTFKNTGS